MDADGVRLHVRERPGDGPAVLLLHGFLDHGHSFDPLCAHLPAGWRLVTLDFRGMGKSGHLPPGAHYAFAQHLLDVEAVVDALGLAPVHLVGHSLGGLVALAYAAARPARVAGAAVVEGLGPQRAAPGLAVERLTGFLDDARRPPRARVYADVDAAAARLRENNPGLAPDAARLLAAFGTEVVDGGVSFTFDPRHRRRFGAGFDEAQWRAVLAAVACPVLLVRGSEGFPLEPGRDGPRLALLRDFPARGGGTPTVETLPGGHHVHLDDPAGLARLLVDALPATAG